MSVTPNHLVVSLVQRRHVDLMRVCGMACPTR